METSVDLQQQGQTAYRSKNYKLALSLFSRALDVSTTILQQIAILDNRAAAYEKIGGTDALKKALGDAKKIIRLQKSSAKGYLRAAKILQHLGEVSTALDMYQHGLKYLHPNDQQGRKLLIGMHQKVLFRSGKASGIDPLSVFPYEIVMMVLDYLPFQTTMRMHRVSKTWRTFLAASRRSYHVLDFSGARSAVSKFTIKTYVKRGSCNIKKVILGKTKYVDTDTLVYLTHRCKQLKELHIIKDGLVGTSIARATKFAEQLTTLVLSCAIRLDSVVDIIRNGRQLETLRCDKIERSQILRKSPYWDLEEERPLKDITLRWEVGPLGSPARIDTSKMFRSLANLRRMAIIDPPRSLFPTRMDFTSLTHLETLQLTNTDLISFPTLPNALLHLDLSENSSLFWEVEQIRESPLPQLQSLIVAGNPWVTNSTILDILSSSTENPKLRLLSVAMCPQIDLDSLKWLTSTVHGETIEELSVAGLYTFSDQVTKELGAMRNLRRLDLACTRISGIGVLNLIECGAGRIQWMCLDQCEFIGRDAVEQAREKGVEVAFKLAVLRGGRKVRYEGS